MSDLIAMLRVSWQTLNGTRQCLQLQSVGNSNEIKTTARQLGDAKGSPATQLCALMGDAVSLVVTRWWGAVIACCGSQ